MRYRLPFLLILLLPTAAAQEQPFSNFEDPTGDQVPASAGTGWADLLRGAMTQTNEALSFSLQVAALGATDPAHYEVVWFRVRGDEAKAIGVGAYVQAGSLTGYRIEPSMQTACSSRTQPLTAVGSVPATLAAGSPGRVTWTLPLADFDPRRGDLYYNFCAFSFARAPAASAFNSDFARTAPKDIVNLSFMVGLPEAVRVGELALHDGTLYADDDPDPPHPEIASYDIEAVQIHVDDTTVDTTVRLKSLDWSELKDQWHLNIALSQYEVNGEGNIADNLRSNLFVRNATLRHALVERDTRNHGEEAARPWTLHVQLGTPGYARFSVPRDNWTLTPDPGGLTVFVHLSSFDRGERADTFYLSPQRFFDLPLPAFLGVAAILVAAWWRRQR